MATEHFYTIDPAGELAPANGHHREGIAGYVYAGPQPNAVPVFRWFNPASGYHFLTTDPLGEQAPAGGYIAEGARFYAFAANVAGTVPMFRWAGPTGEHFYTTVPGGENAPADGYRPEGPVFYVFPDLTQNSTPLFRWFNAGHGGYTCCMHVWNAGGQSVGQKTLTGVDYADADRQAAGLYLQYRNGASYSLSPGHC